MKSYLEVSEIIDRDAPAVREKAKELSAGKVGDRAITKACFEFVRDEIRHSWDYQLKPVTCKASEALEYGTGYCYAKSHLLAALLRANGIPAALCYQRLTVEGDQPPLSLHGLNAVHLTDFRWIRIDARGNNPGVQAEFAPPIEKLAFPVRNKGEADIKGRFARPLDEIVEVLTKYSDFREVAENLPDIELNGC